jgi:amino acid permease
MISIGGVIGQGLFLSSGANLNAAGKNNKKKSSKYAIS